MLSRGEATALKSPDRRNLEHQTCNHVLTSFCCRLHQRTVDGAPTVGAAGRWWHRVSIHQHCTPVRRYVKVSNHQILAPPPCRLLSVSVVFTSLYTQKNVVITARKRTNLEKKHLRSLNPPQAETDGNSNQKSEKPGQILTHAAFTSLLFSSSAPTATRPKATRETSTQTR